jgi:inosine-uridine nucleoside N-ribohydrolase
MDVDDVIAVCMANALRDNGEADLLAIVQNTSPKQCAGVISVLNHYYGHDDVPIGAFKGEGLTDAPILDYVADLVENWPSPIKNTSQVPDSVLVYRKALAAAADHSVAISSIGILTNLAALLQSSPDKLSPLTGKELVAKKVKVLAVMGGKYPKSNGQPECNLCGCAHANKESAATAAAASGYVFSNMPPEVKILFSGFEVGVEVQTGARLSSCAGATNPCREAMINYEHGKGKSRFSWDPLTTLAAVRGAAGVGCTECTNCDGINKVDPNTGNNEWVSGPKSNQTYLLLRDAQAAADAIDTLVCQKPKNPPAPVPTPPPVPGSWTEAKGNNCYGTRDGGRTNHGATDLEKPVTASCGIMTIVQCQEACEKTAGCDGITVKETSDSLYSCYRKANINLEKCDHGSTFDTYVKK